VSVPAALVEAAYAVGIGLAVGFEREHHDLTRSLAPTDVPEEHEQIDLDSGSPMGARTFSILCLGGWLAAYLGDTYAAIAPLIVAVLCVMVMVQYVLVVRGGAPTGMTTEVAGVAVALLGMLVHVRRELAVPLALALILLLISKPWMRSLVKRLRRIEIIATVQLLVLAAIVLPMLPAEPVDPWGAIPPQKVGIFVVLLAAVEYVGYVLHRWFGTRRGIALAGLVGGVASSTAVTAAMAREARGNDAIVAPGQLATFLANAVMGVRVTVIAAFLAPPVAWRLAASMGALVAVLGLAAMVRWRASRRVEIPEDAVALRNPFALVPALTWGMILCVVLLAAHFATEYLGGRGLLLAAAASGLADVDAITLASANEASTGALGADVAALAITIAVASNTLVKGAIALLGGGRRFGVGVAIVFGIALVAMGVAAAIFSVA